MMDQAYLAKLDPTRFPSPCFVVDEARIEANAAILETVQRRTGAKVLLALKGFAMWSLFPLLSRAHGGVLHGTCASSPHEARLGREEFGGEVHAFAAGYSDADMAELVTLADHLVFNSFAQWDRFRAQVAAAGRPIECGIRINPEHSEGAVAIYNPCSPGSRLGVRPHHFEAALAEAAARGQDALDGISGLHFHTLCEQDADALDRTLHAVEAKFGAHLSRMKWLNFGGGHHVTRPGYDLDLLCRCIERMQQTYGVQVYIEPGEAVALNAGVLLCSVLDVVQADMPVVILDTSAAAHMPDVLEMPYRPGCIGSGLPGEKAWTCRFAGKSCLAGDVIGEYSFDAPLQPGDRLAFLDMAIYSMVKTTTFNGLQLPAIGRYRPASPEGGAGGGARREVVRAFGYEAFKYRLS